MGGDTPIDMPPSAPQRFPALPSSRPDSPSNRGSDSSGSVKGSSDATWSSILDELHRAIDDTAVNMDAEPPSSTHSRDFDQGPRGRKRVRSRGRSWSMGAAPTAFASPGGDVPMSLEPAEPSGRIPARAIRGFHPHLYHLRLSSSRPPASEPTQHTVAPRRSSPALLASPIQLMAAPRAPSPSPGSSSLPSLEPMSVEPAARLLSLAPIDFPSLPRPTSAPTLSPSPPQGITFSPSLPASPDSPGSWLRSPLEPRSRFRSDDSASDAIMFTPRQLDFEQDGERFTTLGRRLEWNHFDVGRDTREPPPSLRGMGLGPAFSPSHCTRDEPISPAFGLETEPGVGTS